MAANGTRQLCAAHRPSGFVRPLLAHFEIVATGRFDRQLSLSPPCWQRDCERPMPECSKSGSFGPLDRPCSPCHFAAVGLTVLPSRPGEFHPEPLTGRVGDWRAGLGRCSCSRLSRSFVCECHNISTMPRFQPPPRRTQHADFPHYALLFASRQGLWDLSCWGDFRLKPPNLVAVEQLQALVQPLPTPPRPTEALSFLSPQHMAPNLLFHPVLNVAKALAGVPDREVIQPAP